MSYYAGGERVVDYMEKQFPLSFETLFRRYRNLAELNICKNITDEHEAGLSDRISEQFKLMKSTDGGT